MYIMHLSALNDCLLQAVDATGRVLQQDLASTTELLASDAARLSREVAAVRGDLSGLAGGLQQQQHELGVLNPRLTRLEGLEASNPRASLRLVSALEGKVDNVAAQQVGVETVLGSISAMRSSLQIA